MPLSLKKHVTLLRYQPFTFSCLCNPLTGRCTLPIVLIVPHSPSPSHSHSKALSRLLALILLTHLSCSCRLFPTCSRTLILVAILAFSLYGTLSFATPTVRHTLPSTLSSHSPSIHFLLSCHPVRVTLSYNTHVPSLSHRTYKYLSMVIRDLHLVFASRTYTCPLRDPQLTSLSLSSRSPLLS